MLAASVQNKVTPILLHIYVCNTYTVGKIHSLYKSKTCHCKQDFLIKIGISEPPTD